MFIGSNMRRIVHLEIKLANRSNGVRIREQRLFLQQILYDLDRVTLSYNHTLQEKQDTC